MNHRLRSSQYAILLTALICTQVILLAQTTHKVNNHETGSVIPFVGCNSDGQVGPQEAPKGESKIFVDRCGECATSGLLQSGKRSGCSCAT